jgi:hypothetical protein
MESANPPPDEDHSPEDDPVGVVAVHRSPENSIVSPAEHSCPERDAGHWSVAIPSERRTCRHTPESADVFPPLPLPPPPHPHKSASEAIPTTAAHITRFFMGFVYPVKAKECLDDSKGL